MLITVITVVLNSENYIKQTILSVLEQTYEEIEYIIIDGQSIDNTLNIINQFNSSVIKLISEKDNGIYDAMNKAIRLANGEFVIFLNSGDFFVNKNVISSVVPILKKNNLDIFYSNIEIYHKNSYRVIKPGNLIHLAYKMPFCHQSVFCKKQYLINNLFSLNFKYASDYLFFRNAYYSNVAMCYIDLTTIHFDLNGLSSLNPIKYLKEVKSIICSEKSSLFVFIFSMIGFWVSLIKARVTNLKNICFQ